MSCVCFFDLIPVELLADIFTYLFAHEILHSFSDVSEHVNAFLLAYSNYGLNLQSIQLSDFHLICRRIRPEQVAYLRLSDDNNTPGLSEHFLSRFPIEQFTQLRSLTLLEIEITSLESIFTNLSKLIRLLSFSFNCSTIRFIVPGSETDGIDEINRISQEISDSYTLVVPQLNRLQLGTSADLPNIQLPYLFYLKLHKCSMDHLRTIFLRTPLLKSLDICLENSALTCDFTLTSIQLTRLRLTTENTILSMDDIEPFLSKLTYLKHLVLETHGESDILDAKRWEGLTSNLITFNFHFYIINSSDRNLDSFRTSFWLKEKRWFVASTSNSIFSIPYFSPWEIYFPGRLFTDFTALTDDVFYNQISALTIVASFPDDNNYYRFSHIKTLNLNCSISLKALQSINDLHQVEQLSILTADDILIFNSLASTMPKLYCLSIEQLVTNKQMQEIQGYQFRQIHQLILGLDDMNQDYTIKVLFYLFPCLKCLTCTTYIRHTDVIRRLINGFQDLSRASFYSHAALQTTGNIDWFNPKLFISDKRIFTSRIYHSLNNPLVLHINLWLKEQTSFSPIVGIVRQYLGQYEQYFNNSFRTALVLFVTNLPFYMYADVIQKILKSIADIGLVLYVISVCLITICLFFIILYYYIK